MASLSRKYGDAWAIEGASENELPEHDQHRGIVGYHNAGHIQSRHEYGKAKRRNGEIQSWAEEIYSGAQLQISGTTRVG
jgi:hypothetical protein